MQKLLTVVTVLVGVVLWRHQKHETELPKAPQTFKDFLTLTPTPTKQWLQPPSTTKDEFITMLVQQNVPVILKHTPVSEWKALQHWSPEYLSAEISRPIIISESPNCSHVHYRAKKPLSKSIFFDEPNIGYTDVTTSAREFFTRAKKASEQDPPGEYVYYVEDVKDMDPKFLKYFDSSHFEIPTFKGVHPSKHLSPVSYHKPMVWMGSKGISSGCHFDAIFNFYTQIYGKKQFVLFGPDQSDNLYVYPNKHPRNRQSQVDLQNPNLSKFPQFRQAVGQIAVLSPGDVLFLPPYWFHYVTALDTSISLSLWTQTNGNILYDSSTTTMIPLEEDWPNEWIFSATAVFLRSVLEQLHQSDFGQRHITSLLQRYGQFRACNRSIMIENEFFEGCEIHDTSLLPKFHRQAKIVADYLIQPAKSISDIMVQNYIEDVGAFAVGSEALCRFLFEMWSKCFDDKYKHSL